ncbi:MAG: hypothetical protein EOO75_02230 [Myxococcales bacterium]|nr:MAG: hypothetical protein EOO75_02230 [Myxococcales bacterium]
MADASPPAALPSPLAGFDRRSARLLGLFAVVGGAAAVIWREHVSLSLDDLDPLLGACWVGMAALATHRVQVKRDVRLAAVALAGGALIEAWGTRAGLWTYFTGEQPPLFILPAWPAAALATERVAAWLERRAPSPRPLATNALWLLAMGGFLALLVPWMAPGWRHPLNAVALGCVALTVASVRDRRSELVRFAAGCLVGYPLEYWGTSRGCWTYWSGEVPPLVAVLSHGFATVAFARGAGLVAGLGERRAGA